MKALETAIIGVVAGDLNQLPTIMAATHADLAEASKKLPKLMVSRAALVVVLRAFRSRSCPAESVQQWASFIRRGYVACHASWSIEIDYPEAHEELLVESISRLDEIGDKIDGDIGDDELDEMLALLNS